MPGIEFLAGDEDQPAGDDDLVDGPGPRRPWPRWVWLVAGLLAGAVVVGTVVASRSDDAPDASAGVSSVPSVGIESTAPASAGPQSLPGGVTSDVPIPDDDTGSGAQISALTADGTSLFWLAGTRLYRAGPVGRASISAAISAAQGEFTEVDLVPALADKVVWVVSQGAADSVGKPGVVEAYSATDLSRVTRASAPSLIDGAAVLDGALYVLSGGRLLRIRSGGSGFTPVATVGAHAHGLVAVGDALLFVESGNGSAVGRWTPDGGVAPAVVLDTTDSSLAVVGSTVFLIGTRRGNEVLGTLTPAGQVAAPGFAVGLTQVQSVATGRTSLLVLGMDARGLELACVTANASGGPDLRALLPGTSANVAVLNGLIFQAVGSTVAPVTFPAGTCPA